MECDLFFWQLFLPTPSFMNSLQSVWLDLTSSSTCVTLFILSFSSFCKLLWFLAYWFFYNIFWNDYFFLLVHRHKICIILHVNVCYTDLPLPLSIPLYLSMLNIVCVFFNFWRSATFFSFTLTTPWHNTHHSITH